jgi:SAM-dependent methyltransferase
MAKIVDYEKQTLDNPNPIVRFAHRTRFKLSKQIVYNLVSKNSVVLDFGCGHGRFLNEISFEDIIKNNDCKLLGYDPFLQINFDNFTVVNDAALIPDNSVDIITCLEVVEHLYDNEIDFFLDFAGRKLKPNGKILVTVPIMIGPAIFPKELFRAILHRSWPTIKFIDVIKSGLFGISAPRAINVKISHQGFDWRVAKQKIGKAFSLKKLSFSPIPVIGWYGNSQAIMIFEKIVPD